MVSEPAGEGAMPLSTPASRRLEIAHHPRAVEEKPIEDVLSFPILLSDQIKYAIKEDESFRLECSDDEEDRHNLIGDSEQRNGARSPGRSSFAIDVFNRSSRSRSVRSSAELVIPLFDLVSLSKVLVISLFTVFIRSRSAEILSAELVAVASSPQRRTMKKKQLLTQIRDSGSRSVEFVNQPSVIDSACVGRSLAIQNSAMVCRLPYVNLFFAYVSRSRRGEQLVFASDSACGYCNLVLSEQQFEAEPVKEEPENPPANSIKLKKTKEPKAKKSSAPKKRNSPAHPPYFEMVQEAFVTLKERTGSSQYAIQKFTAKKQRSNSRNLLPFHLKKFVAVDKLVKTGGNLAGVVTARIESSTLSFAAEVNKGKVGKDAPINPRLPTDIIIIMHSNGSTRLPKGDMITNGNIVATSAAIMSVIPNRGTNDVYVAYLLLTHIFELAVETVMKSELVFDGNLHLSEADKRGAVAVVASKEIGIEESLQCECEWACQVLIERTKFVNECADDGTGFVKARILPYTPFLCFILSWTYKTLHAPAYRGVLEDTGATSQQKTRTILINAFHHFPISAYLLHLPLLLSVANCRTSTLLTAIAAVSTADAAPPPLPKEVVVKSILSSYKHGFSCFASVLSPIQAKQIAGVVCVYPQRILNLHTTRIWDFLQVKSHLKNGILRRAHFGVASIIGVIDSVQRYGPNLKALMMMDFIVFHPIGRECAKKEKNLIVPTVADLQLPDDIEWSFIGNL
nr:long chain acyl-CoA synthetase 8 [Ipomoea batatas]